MSFAERGIPVRSTPKAGSESFRLASCFLVTFLFGIAILLGDDPASDSFDLP